jgi:hypothetical protein
LLQQYAEKLIVLANASNSFLDALPAVPPTADNPYKGAKATATTRAAVQTSLNNWVTGHVKVPELNNTSSNANDGDTRSFGESHASELSNINPSTSTASIPSGGALNASPSLPHTGSSQSSTVQPVNISNLNLTPIQVSAHGSQDRVFSVSPTSGDPAASLSQQSLPTITPTIAETGIPLSSGAADPGPKQGSLAQQSKTPAYGSVDAGATPSYGHPSAEDEKKRLAREERERVLNNGGSSSTPKYESAEDEKKRLERAERERVLQLGATDGASGSGTDRRNETRQDDHFDGPPPPAYHD